MKNPRATAFTLIELLVVISIIALLIAILLPALGKAKERAKDLKCVTQLDQIVTAQYAYATDAKGKFTPQRRWDAYTIFKRAFGRGTNESAGSDYGWTGTGLLYYKDYLPEMLIAWCPSNESPVFNYDNADQGFRVDPWTTGTHWMSQNYHQQIGIEKQDDVNYNSDTAFYADSFTFSNFYNPGVGDSVTNHHKVGYNVVYLDGSVEFYNDSGDNIKDLRIPGGKGGNGWDRRMEPIWEDYLDRDGELHGR